MNIADIRYLFDYDRWATRRVLDAAAGIGESTWSAPNEIGERGLGGILVHQLGAQQRWRHGLSGATGEFPRPERDALPTVEALRTAWETEWRGYDDWLATLDEADMERTDEGVPYWRALAHVVNHGTQHRSEAAALLTSAGRSPGDLDMIDYAEGLVGDGADAPKAAASGGGSA